MKILALDLGDQWVGVAISDALCMIARPYKTVTNRELNSFLENLFRQERIDTVLVGYPKTMRGTESDQTKKIVLKKEELEKKFSEKKWLLCDERLTSKQALSMGKMKDKLEIHARSAALILESYLLHLQFQKSLE